MPTLCLEYAKSMVRVCLGRGLSFKFQELESNRNPLAEQATIPES